MNQQARVAANQESHSNGLSLVFGIGAYLAMIPFVFAASCIMLVGI